MKISEIPSEILEEVRKGMAIPAMPLALDENRKFDEAQQRILTRYYIDAGSGGIACGVHSTQFEIRDPEVGLFEPVLRVVSKTIDEYCEKINKKILKVSGVCGGTEQAIKEAEFAVATGYHASLLSLAALKDSSIDEIIEHCKKVAEVIPIIGFYLQPAVGGRVLPYEFWRKFVDIDNVLAIKMAPFNRYQTFDVVRAVCEAGKENEITLYTGNDDNIVIDLLSEYKIQTSNGEKRVRIKGGLLGHFCVWTKAAVELLQQIHEIVDSNNPIPPEILTLAIEVTDSNAALFDTANNFEGCIPGIHEILRRQGLMKGIWCLNPDEILSPGQSEELDRVCKSYPHLIDDDFIRDNLSKWSE
ncbi:MAG: dihydrodipicolinate synthase family protein [Planctomycetota bacterium]|nr:MAG: dihydrodipicolinate synthase family protein [Planctomycetota bacterium]